MEQHNYGSGRTDIKHRYGVIMQRYSIFMVLAFLFIICSFANPNFLSITNLSNISRQLAVTTIIAFGETILIICGMIDLSAGSVIALSGVLSVAAFKATESLLIALAVGVTIGIICNMINAVMVTSFKVPPFIATLAMQTMARGVALLYTRTSCASALSSCSARAA
jgi:inositol transport system permease protein